MSRDWYNIYKNPVQPGFYIVGAFVESNSFPRCFVTWQAYWNGITWYTDDDTTPFPEYWSKLDAPTPGMIERPTLGGWIVAMVAGWIIALAVIYALRWIIWS